ncbi:GDSL esterase/lipase At5g08460 [Sesamum indicum]|uniref:GDSL esterase/lipase At5g08460 n=1 Tax=Sesamum indicum TaxID=4182 RepID=A0A6I9TE95_SESIN|nr:GDSL esterase/lipase At5g08460 [Sesamum indicum]
MITEIMGTRLAILLLMSGAGFIILEATAEPQFTAMYVFGDSLTDPGNNIYFNYSVTKANYWPYGIDSDIGPTGRFCNGKTLVDFIGEFLGLPLIPSYADTAAKGADILSGVNYASAGAGILEETGYHFGRVIPLGEQVSNFKTTLNQLRNQMQEEELSNYLAKAIVFVDMGANDYLNNYLLPHLYRSMTTYSPQQFADLLINLYTGHILELQSLGLRKFFIAEAAPIGCIPFIIGSELAPSGKCQNFSNNLVQIFNSRLKPLVYNLNSDHPGSVFTLGSSYQLFMDLRDNAEAYGFMEKDGACCGIGGRKGACLPNTVPCSNRDEYIFWDEAHPTQATNWILATWIYNNTSYTFPVSIQQMARM